MNREVCVVRRLQLFDSFVAIALTIASVHAFTCRIQFDATAIADVREIIHVEKKWLYCLRMNFFMHGR
jgi:hypothetical protein